MTITDYHNFDLLIACSGDAGSGRYRAFVVDAPAGEASILFDLSLGADELSLRRGRERGANLTARRVDESAHAASLKDVGSRLFTAIFRDRVQAVLASSLSSAAQEGAGLRVRLRFEEDAADLATLPWETLYDPVQRHFVGLGETSPILRYLSLPRSRSALLVEPPLRVLTVLAGPRDLPGLDIEGEWQVVQEALAGLVSDGKFVLERLASPTLDALQKRLLREPMHILHFVGHGIFDQESQLGGLALEDGQGRCRLVRGEDLGKLLRNHPDVRLAYLNACEGALSSGASIFSGVAQALVQGGVPAVVAMQTEISDAAAIDLARTFYTALAAGRPVDAALTQARVALNAGGSEEWAIPVLFSRSPDNRLFDIRQVLPTPDCPYPGMEPFSEKRAEVFFGRDKEIEKAVKGLRQHPFLAVVGPSGSGKSSLVHAGVIPALRKSRGFGPGEWRIVTMRPSDSRTVDGKAAPRAALAGKLGCPPDALIGQVFNQRTLLFIDQFEELFTLTDADEKKAFLDIIQGLKSRPNLYILLTVGTEYYPQLMACPLWEPIRVNRLEPKPLGNDELWAAIVEPAGRVGVTVDEALAVKLVDDATGQPGALPLLQATLLQLWDKVEGQQLRLNAYREMTVGDRGGLEVAIDSWADKVYNSLPEDAQPIARRILLRLIQFSEERADTRRQTVTELRAKGDDRAVFDHTLARLIQSRLLTASGETTASGKADDDDCKIDISHKALIAGWTRLQKWLDERGAAEQTRRRLEAKAAEWVRLGRGKGGLLDKVQLREVTDGADGLDASDLGRTDSLVALVEASRAALRVQRQRQAMTLASVSILVLLLAVFIGARYQEWEQKRVLERERERWRLATGTKLIPIEGGPAIIGAHTVTLSSFQIEQYEVRNAQYRACMEYGPCAEPKKFEGVARDDDYPVVGITASQAHVYCTWLDRRLPTSLEWERAARGSEGRDWPWGSKPEPSEEYEFPDDLVPVDSAPETATLPTHGVDPIYHLADNVSEWVVWVSPDCDSASCRKEWDGQSKEAIAMMGGAYDRHMDRITEAPIYSSIVEDPSIGFRCAADSLP